MVQVYAPSNEAEYREYREWFLSINTASGGDRYKCIIQNYANVKILDEYDSKTNIYLVKPKKGFTTTGFL